MNAYYQKIKDAYRSVYENEDPILMIESSSIEGLLAIEELKLITPFDLEKRDALILSIFNLQDEAITLTGTNTEEDKEADTVTINEIFDLTIKRIIK